MFAYQAWNLLTPELNHEVLETACQHEKKLYRRVVQEMAQNLRRRPQMLLEMPRAQRHELFRPLLGLPHFDVLGQNLIIVWLSKTQVQMMSRFLDALGISHDGKGYAESFPDEVEAGRLRAAVDALYAGFDAGRVSLYLRVLDRVSGVRWPELESMIPGDPVAAGQA